MVEAADGGGGYGGTDWSSKNVVEMWQAIENQDPNVGWDVANSWNTSSELLVDPLIEVQNYQNELTSAWPPEKSPASAAYSKQLDGMINHMQQTYDSTNSNFS